MSEFFSIVAVAAFIVAVVVAVRLLRATAAPTRRTRRWLAGSALTWIGAFALSLVAWQPSAADASVSATGDGQPLLSVAGYDQTWPKGYADTSCAEFADDMTSTQRFAAAADMLTVVWMKIESTDASPSDTLILQYQDALAAGCEYPEEKIAEVAWSVWIHDPRFSA